MLKRYNGLKNPPPPKRPRRPQWWAGALTLVLIVGTATLLSWGAQVALGATRELDSHLPYFAVYALNFVGLTAGAVTESGGHGLIYDLHGTGQTVAFGVNAAFYGVLIFLWLKYHGDGGIKK